MDDHHLYWHPDKQRYFPAPPPPIPRSTAPPVKTAAWSSCRALSDLRSVSRTARKDVLVHRLLCSQISLTDTSTRSSIPIQGRVSAFQTVSHDGYVFKFVGDTLGWFYSSVQRHPDAVDTWENQHYLSSEVSSIVLSPTACIATSFGPECRIFYFPLDSPAQSTHISRVGSHIVHDVWTTDLYGPRLVLGANKQAVIIEDIAVCTSLRRLPTQSDVFALAQRENFIYAGLRNGGTLRFDTRVQKSQSHRLFDSASQRSGSVTALKLIHDNKLLVSFLDGGISIFDLRFPIRTPWMTLTGNFNSYTTKLPVATDPHEQFLFAAGQDNRIRLWSLISGGPPLSTAGTVFERQFEHRIAALQVEQSDGMCLWAASGTELCKYRLGHRSGIGSCND